jgi:hypothetical protein
MPVPEDYLNKNFGDLFNYLSIERNLIPLALYRLPGAVDNKHPYVYTNPPPDTKLIHRDKVFVLAHHLPNDLSTACSYTLTRWSRGFLGQPNQVLLGAGGEETHQLRFR